MNRGHARSCEEKNEAGGRTPLDLISPHFANKNKKTKQGEILLLSKAIGALRVPRGLPLRKMSARKIFFFALLD